jgi:hypothetical protein
VFRNKRVEKELIITANQLLNLVSLRDALKEENLNLTEEVKIAVLLLYASVITSV